MLLLAHRQQILAENIVHRLKTHCRLFSRWWSCRSLKSAWTWRRTHRKGGQVNGHWSSEDWKVSTKFKQKSTYFFDVEAVPVFLVLMPSFVFANLAAAGDIIDMRLDADKRVCGSLNKFKYSKISLHSKYSLQFVCHLFGEKLFLSILSFELVNHFMSNEFSFSHLGELKNWSMIGQRSHIWAVQSKRCSINLTPSNQWRFAWSNCRIRSLNWLETILKIRMRINCFACDVDLWWNKLIWRCRSLKIRIKNILIIRKLTSLHGSVAVSMRVALLLMILLLWFFTASVNSRKVGAAPSGPNNTLFLAL